MQFSDNLHAKTINYFSDLYETDATSSNIVALLGRSSIDWILDVHYALYVTDERSSQWNPGPADPCCNPNRRHCAILRLYATSLFKRATR